MPPFSDTHKGHSHTEYPFVYAPGLHSKSFSMYYATQETYRNGASLSICTCGLVGYLASENVTPIFTTFIFNGGGSNIACQDKVLLLNCTGRMRAVLGSIYTEQKRTRKGKFSFIFAAAQCEQQVGFSKNLSGSDVTFVIATNVISTIGVKGFSLQFH